MTTAIVGVGAVAAATITNNVEMAHRNADAIVAIAEQHGFVGQIAFGSFFQGWTRAMKGAYDERLSQMERSEEILMAIGNDVFRSCRLVALADAPN
jgi:hypothetical protein